MERSEGQAGPPEVHPFGETTDPGIYVPREATEIALDGMVRGLLEEEGPVALVGPPGIGKTLLLHRAAARVRHRLEPVHLPYAALDLPDLCAWALGASGRQVGREPVAYLGGECRRRAARGSGMALLIDEAGSMPLETARDLAKLVDETRGGLRLALAATEDAQASRVFAALAGDLHPHRLTDPMDEADTARYVETRLERAGATAPIRARFDPGALTWLHTVSGGNPRRLHDIATELIAARPEDVGHAWWEERWLGSPIDDEAAEDDDLLAAELPAVLLEPELGAAGEGEDAA